MVRPTRSSRSPFRVLHAAGLLTAFVALLAGPEDGEGEVAHGPRVSGEAPPFKRAFSAGNWGP